MALDICPNLGNVVVQVKNLFSEFKTEEQHCQREGNGEQGSDNRFYCLIRGVMVSAGIVFLQHGEQQNSKNQRQCREQTIWIGSFADREWIVKFKVFRGLRGAQIGLLSSSKDIGDLDRKNRIFVFLP